MSKEKNKYVNNLLKEFVETNNIKYYHKRIGRCDWKKCQSACCRFHHTGMTKCKGSIITKHANYHKPEDEVHKVSNGHIHTLIPFLCQSISFDGRCEIHNKRDQPRVCKYFPMTPYDNMFKCLEHICSYKFIKLKNKKYKKNKLVKEK